MSVSTSTSTSVDRPLPSREELSSFVLEKIRPFVGREETLWLTLPAPVLPPEALLGAAKLPFGLLWDPPYRRAVAGIGWAHRIDVDGGGRISQLRHKAESIWQRLKTEHHPVAIPLKPRFLGGLAFDIGAGHQDPWTEFGDGSFSIPRFTYSSDKQSASLSVAFRGDVDTAELFLEETSYVIDRLDSRRHLDLVLPSGPAAELDVRRPDVTTWGERIEAIRDEIAAGRFEKIVAADRSIVELAAPVDRAVLLDALSRGLMESIRFAFCREQTTFLGATPERLVRLEDRQFQTEALAGSIEKGPGQAETLLQSTKDLEEHRLVVESIRRRLAPITRELTVAESPGVRELRDVIHLHTPIAGQLRDGLHILELVDRLHPTPAVGGVPTEGAIRWIGEHDPPRGWYAAPIGWFDADGNGDFAVALRTTLLFGSRAYVYAGAGIVGDSDPDAEYRETELKKRVILAALGAAIERDG